MAKARKKPAQRAQPVAPVIVESAPLPVAPRRSGVRTGPVATLTAYVDPSLARTLRIRAAEEGTTSSSIIGAALAAHLGAT